MQFECSHLYWLTPTISDDVPQFTVPTLQEQSVPAQVCGNMREILIVIWIYTVEGGIFFLLKLIRRKSRYNNSRIKKLLALPITVLEPMSVWKFIRKIAALFWWGMSKFLSIAVHVT